MNLPLLFVVAIALIDPQGRILLARRPKDKHMADLWEFAGGKLGPDETPEQALVREVREELGITVDERDLHPLTFASFTYDTFHLFMPLYACRKWQGTPTALEHQALAWVEPKDFSSYPMPPADAPLAAFLVNASY